MTPIDRIHGTAIALRGDDIDTDRIIPARYLRAVSFDGLEAHVFEDDRRALADRPEPHPFDRPSFAGASILLVNGNFGCGSSREHAPQALLRWGIRAMAGESFSEIFFGNAIALGIPCLRLEPADVAWLMAAIERDPTLPVTVSVPTSTVEAGGRTLAGRLPEGARDAFLTGAWDATGLLLDNYAQVDAVARRLPYLTPRLP